jgi:hypothetical protein
MKVFTIQDQFTISIWNVRSSDRKETELVKEVKEKMINIVAASEGYKTLKEQELEILSKKLGYKIGYYMKVNEIIMIGNI